MPATYTTTLFRNGLEIEVEVAFYSAAHRGRDRYGWTEPASWEHEDRFDFKAKFTDTNQPALLSEEEREDAIADVRTQQADDEEARAVDAYEDRMSRDFW